MNKQVRIFKIYKNKILAVRNYSSEKTTFSIEDFLDIKTLAMILDEIDTGESDITPAGKAFLVKYFDLKLLSEQIISQKLLTESIEHFTVDELKNWMESLKPMETYAFIEESQVKHNQSK